MEYRNTSTAQERLADARLLVNQIKDLDQVPASEVKRGAHLILKATIELLSDPCDIDGALILLGMAYGHLKNHLEANKPDDKYRQLQHEIAMIRSDLTKHELTELICYEQLDASAQARVERVWHAVYGKATPLPKRR